MDFLIGILIFALCMGIPYIFLYYFSTYRRTMKKGFNHLKLGDYDDALLCFEKCLAKYPGNIHALYYRDFTLLNLDRFENIENNGRKLVNQKPHLLMGYSLLIMLYDKTGNYSMLISIGDELINKVSKYRLDGMLARSCGYSGLGKYELAETDLKSILETQPDNETAMNNLGYVLIKQGRYEDGIKTLEKVIRINPGYAYAYNNLGLGYGFIGDYDKAIKCFDISYELDPANPHLLLHSGIVFYLMGDYKNAVENLQKAIDANPLLRNDANEYIEKIDKQ